MFNQSKLPSTHKSSVLSCKTNIVTIEKDIREDATWTSGCIYLISKEIHVRCGVTLTIKKNTKVLFKSGLLKEIVNGGLPYASLVIDSGASLIAKQVEFSNEIKAQNSTGGVIIVGTLQYFPRYDLPFLYEFPLVLEQDTNNYTSVTANFNVQPGKSFLKNVSFNFLGNNQADINTLTLFRVRGNGDGQGNEYKCPQGVAELYLSNISITNAGDDGLEIFGGDHVIDHLSVFNSLDDNIDLDWNSSLLITKSLTNVRNSPSGTSFVDPNNIVVTPALGGGLFEVFGTENTLNTIFIAANTLVFLLGKYVDKPNDLIGNIGLYIPSGTFLINSALPPTLAITPLTPEYRINVFLVTNFIASSLGGVRS